MGATEGWLLVRTPPFEATLRSTLICFRPHFFPLPVSGEGHRNGGRLLPGAGAAAAHRGAAAARRAAGAPAPQGSSACERETASGCGSKNRNSKLGCPGKWTHGPKPAVCPSCVILSHTHLGRRAAPQWTNCAVSEAG